MTIKCYMCRKNVNVNGKRQIKKERCCICMEDLYESMIVLECDHFACKKCTEKLLTDSYSSQINSLNNLFIFDKMNKNSDNSDSENSNDEKNIDYKKVYKEYCKLLNESLLTNLYMLNIKYS